MDSPALMKPMTARRLTPAERGLAARMFGQGLDPVRVWIWALVGWNRGFVPSGRLIVWPARRAFRDFGQAPLRQQAVFVHELAHVWQAQNGINMLTAKLKAGDRPCDYAYDLEEACAFQARNIEQQAMIFEHAFLAACGDEAPYPAAMYAEVLPTKPFA